MKFVAFWFFTFSTADKIFRLKFLDKYSITFAVKKDIQLKKYKTFQLSYNKSCNMNVISNHCWMKFGLSWKLNLGPNSFNPICLRSSSFKDKRSSKSISCSLKTNFLNQQNCDIFLKCVISMMRSFFNLIYRKSFIFHNQKFFKQIFKVVELGNLDLNL